MACLNKIGKLIIVLILMVNDIYTFNNGRENNRQSLTLCILYKTAKADIFSSHLSYTTSKFSS